MFAAVVIIISTIASIFISYAELSEGPPQSYNVVWPILAAMTVLTAVGLGFALLARKRQTMLKYSIIFDMVYFLLMSAFAAFLYYFIFTETSNDPASGKDHPDSMLLLLMLVMLLTRFDIKIVLGLLTAQFAMFLTVVLMAEVRPLGIICAYLLSVCGAFTIWVMRVRSFVSEKNFSALVSSDFLTGVHNRRGFDIMYEKAWEDAIRYGDKLTIYMIDIDHFKRYNDRHGHLEGDKCLKAVASTINEAIRKGDSVARYGGEEFIVLTKNTDRTGEKRIASRIMSSIAAKAIKHGDSVTPYVTVSIGYANHAPLKDSGLTRTDLIRLADEALYNAKASGRDEIVYYEDMKKEESI